VIRAAAALNDNHILCVELGDGHIGAKTHVIRVNVCVGTLHADLIGGGGTAVLGRVQGPRIRDGGIEQHGRGAIIAGREIALVVEDLHQRKLCLGVYGRGLDVLHDRGMGGVSGHVQHGSVLPVSIWRFGHEGVLRVHATPQQEAPAGVIFGGIECVGKIGSAGGGPRRSPAEINAQVVHQVARQLGAVGDGGGGEEERQLGGNHR